MSLEGTQCERFENNCFSRGENCKPFRFSCNLSVSLNFNAYTFGHCVIFSDKKITTHPSPNVMATTPPPSPNVMAKKKTVTATPPPPPKAKCVCMSMLDYTKQLWADKQSTRYHYPTAHQLGSEDLS